MFNAKHFAVALLAVAASAPSFATLASSEITLSQTGPNSYSGSFAASSSVNSFFIDLGKLPTGLTDLTAGLSANFFGAGYDITGVTFDGKSFKPEVNVNYGSVGFDWWTYEAAGVTQAVHTIVVTGHSVGGSNVGFTGSLSVSNTPITPPHITAVPEPETYAMLLAGLGLMGAIARRRGMKRES
jgi:hypothetical protein